MNNALLILEIVTSSLALIFLLKKFKNDGIYLFVVILSILLGIISQKTVEIFDLKINLGFIISTLIIISSNIIVQKKGPEEIIKIISIIILSNVTLYVFSILTSLMSSSNIHNISNYAFNKVFYLNKRSFFASCISISSSIYLCSMLYHQIRQIKNKIWISNILSMIIICFIECLLFCIITYAFKISALNIIELIVIRYVFTTIIGIAGTSIIYIADKIER